MKSPFLFLLFGLSLTLVFVSPATAQEITAERNVLVQGYSVFEKGRPMAVTPLSRDKFLFLEYWRAGYPFVRDSIQNETLNDIKRKQSTYHLQAFSTSGMREQFFQPINATAYETGGEGDSAEVIQGQDGLVSPTQMLRMKDGVAVVGTRAGNGGGPPQTVVNIFDAKGNPTLESLIELSSISKKRSKTFKEWVKVSPNGEYLLWIGKDGRRLSGTLIDYKGEEIWREPLEIALLKDGFKIADIELADDGTPNFLMKKTKIAAGDPMILLRYQDTTGVFLEQPITVDANGYPVHVELYMLANGEAVVTGTSMQVGADSVAIQNGEKLEEQTSFSHLFICSYKPTFGTLLENKYTRLHALPNEWIEKYQERGANFSRYKLVGPNSHLSKGGKLIFMMEEVWKGKRMWFFQDVAFLAYNLENGNISWKNRLEKRQRDTGEFLMSFVTGVAKERLRIVYITEMGARGMLTCKSYNMTNGDEKSRTIASNAQAQYLFFPAQSSMISNSHMVLMGMGDNPAQNGFKLVTISF